MSRPIIAVVGPTATGKSDLGIELALALDGEIVNADAFQLYRGMDVGTAKTPDPQRRGVPHHLIDVLDPVQDSSVARYQADARAVLADIEQRGKVAVVVGGSGLYVRALLDEMVFPGTDPQIRAELEAWAAREGSGVLHDELGRLDPAAAGSIAPGNARRIVRALEVIKLTGRPYTATLPRQRYVRPTVQVGLDCDRAVLDERITDRVNRMWERGLVDEVRRLAPTLGRTARRAVGYAEVLDMLEGLIDEAAARDLVAANTRRLARKQMGWFGRDPRVRWLDAMRPDLMDAALGAIATPTQATQVDGPVRRSLGS